MLPIQDLKNIEVNKQLYCVTNTCAFDSIVQIMFSSYVDSYIYAEWLNTNSSNILFKLVINATRDGITSQTYKKRAYILKPIISEYKQLNETPDGLIILDSACTANYMYQTLFEKYSSYTEVRECLTCNYNQTKLCITITANLPTESIDFMQDVLKRTFEEYRKCIQCTSSIKPKYISGTYLLIESVTKIVQYGQDKTQFDLQVVLKDIPIKINLFDKQFTLRGLINFIQPPKCMSMDAIGHYVSYNWRETNNSWERCDDLLNCIRHVRPSTEINNCQFIMYTL